jgi:hypothetical protein
MIGLSNTESFRRLRAKYAQPLPRNVRLAQLVERQGSIQKAARNLSSSGIKVSRWSLSRIMANKQTPPREKRLAIAQYFGVAAEDLWPGLN